jgi:hypothetical protein
MNKSVLRSERYKAIILVSIGLSILGIMVFCDMPKMFSRGYIRIDQWHMGDIIKPLAIIFGFIFVATKYLSLQNRRLKNELQRLRPKYLSILKGTFKKNLPSINDLRWEIASKIKRCIRWGTRLSLYEDLYGLCLLQGVLGFDRQPNIGQEMVKWLLECDYPEKKRLDLLEERVRGLAQDEVELFRFLQVSLLKDERFLEPKGKILSRVMRHEFYQVDDIPFYLEELGVEDMGREGMVGVFASIVVFCLFLGGGILERILPLNLIGTKDHFRG